MAAESASPAEIVTTPSIGPSFSNSALVASATSVALPKAVEGKGNLVDLPPALRVAVGYAFTDDVLLAVSREILASREARWILFVANIFQYAEFFGRASYCGAA
jgi:hypothetical protein